MAESLAKDRDSLWNGSCRSTNNLPHAVYGRQGSTLGRNVCQVQAQARPLHGSGRLAICGLRVCADWDVMSDVTKSRLYGFDDVVDSEAMFVRLLGRFREERIVP